MRLIDEALASEPVKNTFRLGWEFIVINKPLSLTIIVLLFVLSILGTIPIIGVLFSLFSTLLSLAVQIYIGRLVYESENIEHFVHDIKSLKGETIIKQHFSAAVGAYGGWMVIGLVLVTLASVVVGSMGLSELNLSNGVMFEQNREALFMIFSTILLPLLVFFLIFSYVQPLVQSNIVMANDFKEGFFAVMTLFSAKVWQDAFQKSYFGYIFKLSLVILLLGVLFGILFSLVGRIPFLNIFLVIIFFYILMIILTVASMMAKRVVE
jgi:hypothetical protein